MRIRFINLSAFCLLLALVGCPSNTGVPVKATGEAISRAAVRGDSAQQHVQAVIPDVKNGNKVHLESADKDLGNQKNDLREAREQLTKANTAFQTEHDEFMKVKGSISYKIGLFLASSFKWIIGLGIAGVVLRAIALKLTGPFGAVLSIISTVIFGVLSAGWSLIQSGFDNLWFRKFSPTKGGS